MKPNSIDLGVAICARHCQLGVPKTSSEIASYCTWNPTTKKWTSTSRQRIDQIEKRALRKIRIKLHCDKVLLDALQNR